MKFEKWLIQMAFFFVVCLFVCLFVSIAFAINKSTIKSIRLKPPDDSKMFVKNYTGK